MALPRKTAAKTAYQAYVSEWEWICKEDTVYLITWNPKPRFYSYDKLGENNYVMQWQTMLDKLCGITRCSHTFAFVAEVSDQGKLHMHGFIKVSDKIKFHKSFLPTLRRNGFVKMNEANSTEWKTFKYHVKDIRATADYLTDDDYPIVITSDNVFTVKKNLSILKSLVINPDLPKKAVKKMNVMRMMMDAGLKFEDDE